MSTQQLTKPAESESDGPFYLVPAPPSTLPGIKLSEFLTIGRDSANHLQLNDPFASQRHARVERKGSHYLLRDLRSRNGTYVNGARICECILSLHDRISFATSEFILEQTERLPGPTQTLQSKNALWNQQLEQIPFFAKTEFSVLILGASGTGKELIAESIHALSDRADGPFVSVNCSALSESLVESELFGHVRGSFTGATHDRKGAFEAARGGTLFLDEIGDLPLSLQPKLLRALENSQIRPVGSDKVVKTDVRIVAATHHNLQQKVTEKEFRADLFFRLNVIKMNPPPLVQRMEDFEDLLYSFARQMRVRFSFQAIREMHKHSWPGNIRELKNSVARAAACFPGVQIEPQHLPFLIDPVASFAPEPHQSLADGSIIKEIEKEIIRKRLIANHGNQRRTAMDLGIPKSTLHDRIRAYGIDLDEIMKNGPLMS